MDNRGDNISKKNVNYCETTALYWMWKNRLEDKSKDDAKYFGLSQYRRMFTFTDEDMRKIFANDVDVVLPYPMIMHKRLPIFWNNSSCITIMLYLQKKMC